MHRSSPIGPLHWQVWLASSCYLGSQGWATGCRAPKETGNRSVYPHLHDASWKHTQTVRGETVSLCRLVLVHVWHDWGNAWIYFSDLELMGDKGGEVGAGVSASSSSSSPHSSSLSGVMLLPSHTEWMETWRRRRIHLTLHKFRNLVLTTSSSYIMHLVPVLVCSPCCPSPSPCWSEATASHGWSAYLLFKKKKKKKNSKWL